MRNIIKAVACVAAAAALACGGDSGGGGGSTAKVNSATSTGEVKMSGSVGVSGGKLAISLSAIRDPDDASKPADPANVTLAVTTGAGTTSALSLDTGSIQQGIAAPAISCTLGRATASSAKADLVFINDTTGSMSGTVTGIVNSVDTFSTAIAGSVDAQFSMYTYGDAFATASTPPSKATFKGDFAPPSIDTVERPYCALGALTPFKAFLNDLKTSSVLGTGGGDGPENTIGTIAYAAGLSDPTKGVAWREGAAKVLIAIGDNPSHQAGDGTSSSYPAQFKPVAGTDLVAQINAKGYTIHVVGNDCSTFCGTNFNLKLLADGTGGAFIDLPSDGNVDLSALHVTDWFTKSFSGLCSGAPAGNYKIIINATVRGSAGTTKTGTLTFDITVS